MSKKQYKYKVETLAKSNEFRAYQDILKGSVAPNTYLTKEEAKEIIENHLNKKVGE